MTGHAIVEERHRCQAPSGPLAQQTGAPHVLLCRTAGLVLCLIAAVLILPACRQVAGYAAAPPPDGAPPALDARASHIDAARDAAGEARFDGSRDAAGEARFDGSADARGDTLAVDLSGCSAANCPGGTCHFGVCCTGCIDDTGTQSCVGLAAQTVQSCGSLGAACTSCDVTPNSCRVAECLAGSCGEPLAPAGTACRVGIVNGKCDLAGSCCTGCLRANGSCQATPSAQECGIGGKPCKSCGVVCLAGLCV